MIHLASRRIENRRDCRADGPLRMLRVGLGERALAAVVLAMVLIIMTSLIYKKI